MRRIDLEVTGRFLAEPMLGALAAHSLPRIQSTVITNVEGTMRGVVTRLVSLDGVAARIEVRIENDQASLRLPADLDEARTERAVALVRTWLDLDQSPAERESVLARDPRLAPLVALRPGLRIVGHPDPFEAAVTTVLGQRVSLAAGAVFGARFVDFFAPHGELVEFPRPAVVARADPAKLRQTVGVTGARARCVIELAALFADGLDPLTQEGSAVRRRLLDVPGVGPWTVEYLAVRVLGDRDAYPSGDLVLQRALGVRSAREAERLAEGWRPWRAYGLFHLWTAESYVARGSAPRPAGASRAES